MKGSVFKRCGCTEVIGSGRGQGISRFDQRATRREQAPSEALRCSLTTCHALAR